MKELSIEEKARAYDEALERAKKVHKYSSDLAEIKRMEEIFHELRENKDEKIRNSLLRWLQSNSYTSIAGIQINDVIDWLERQGENKEINEISYRIGIKRVLDNPESYGLEKQCKKDKEILILKDKIESLHAAIKAIKETSKIEVEKQGENKTVIEMKSPEESLGISSKEYNEIVNDCIYNESKPADNIKAKFNIGDWVILDNKISCNVNNIYQGKESLMYTITDTNNMIRSYSVKSFDSNARLWTLADAKPGDILSNGKMIVIFKQFEDPSYRQHIIAYIGLDNFGRIQITDEHWELGIDKAKPATKEQCDILFQKMGEYGYTWNAEKKELLEIEEELTDFEKSLKHIMIETLECGDTRNLKADAEMLLRIAQKPKEWSHEDEKRINRISDFIWKNRKGDTDEIYQQEQDVNWIKSFKDRYTWKPSYEQLEALWCAAENYLESDNTNVVELRGKVLESLYHELKKHCFF